MQKHFLLLLTLLALGFSLSNLSAQGALLPNGRNAFFIAAGTVASLESDGVAAVGPTVGYSMYGQVDVNFSGGWILGSQAYKGNYFGGGLEIHVLKEFPAPVGLSLQGNYQGNFFGTDPDVFFSAADYGSYFLGGNIYKTLRGETDRRPALFFLSPGISGLNSNVITDDGSYFTLRTGFLINTYTPGRIFSLALGYQRIFDAIYGGNAVEVSALYSFSKREQ